jgi:hypothetical protein
MDDSALEERLAALERTRAWSPRVVSKFESLLRAGEEEKLFRMNPVAFAAERGVAEGEAIDLFLHATRAGLLVMEWQLLCPGCGQYIHSLDSLRAVRDRARCVT